MAWALPFGLISLLSLGNLDGVVKHVSAILCVFPRWCRFMWRCYLLSYRGKRSIDPAQGNPYNTLPPSERRELWGVGTVYVRTLTYPLRFITWGTREMCFSRCARASISVKGTFEVRFEPETWTTSNVMVLPTYWAKGVKDRSITQPKVINITVYRTGSLIQCYRCFISFLSERVFSKISKVWK